MLRIAALNDTVSSEDDPRKIQLTKTKEAKEAEAFSAYNKALLYQQKGHLEHAEKLLRNLLTDPFLQEASDLVEEEKHLSNHHGLQLLYSIHKNLAAIMLEHQELREAMKYYIEAVRIDPSEVTVWFKMGQTACKLDKYQLAKQCFQQALQCNNCHWPSLDKAITVTFALGDYLMCLEHISTALEKDCCYPKGLALRKQILKEQPSLESLTKELFEYCDPSIFTVPVTEDEVKGFLEEPLKIRSRCRQQVNDYKEEQSKPMAFLEPLIPFTWNNFGQQLIKLYDHATTSNPPKSLSLEMDLRDYYFLDPSVFLGQNSDTVSKEKEQKQKGTAENNTSGKLKITTLPAKASDTNEMNAFQKASEKNNQSRGIPGALSVRDEAKENALVKRLHGETLLGDRVSSPAGPSEKVASNEDGPEFKRPRLITLQDQGECTLEDMAAGNDIDLPLLGDMEMDLDINLSDIRKMDLKPELLLKAGEDELALADAKSLDNVLSSVIDMENEREESSAENVDSAGCIDVSEVIKMDITGSETPSDKETKDITSISSTSEEKITSISQSEQKTRDGTVPLSVSTIGSEPQTSAEHHLKLVDTSDKRSEGQNEDLLSEDKQTSKSSTENAVKMSSQPTKDLMPVQDPHSVDKVLVSESTRVRVSKDLSKVQTSLSSAKGFDVLSPITVDLQAGQTTFPQPKTSPITSSLLSSSSKYPSSATFYHNILNETRKNNPPFNKHSDASSTVAKSNDAVTQEVKGKQISLYEQKFHRSISEPAKSLGSDGALPRRVEITTCSSFGNFLNTKGSQSFASQGHNMMDTEMKNPSTVAVNISKSSSMPQLSPQKSAGEFIEEVVKVQLGMSSSKISTPSASLPSSTIHVDLQSPTSCQRQLASGSDSMSLLQRQLNVMSPPTSSSVNKKSPTRGSIGSNTSFSSEPLGTARPSSSSASSRKRLAFLNIPEHYLNSLSIMEASASTDRARGESSGQPLPYNLTNLPSKPHSSGQPYFHSRHRAPMHPLISPPVTLTGSSPLFPIDRVSMISPSSLLSPPPRSHTVAPVLPPYPLLSHQQDFSFAPHSASLMTSLYPPLSPTSKYPFIPSTSPSYLQSRLLGRNLLDSNFYLPSSGTPYLLPSTQAATSPLSRKQHSPFTSQPSYQTDMQASPVRTDQVSHPFPHAFPDLEMASQALQSSDIQKKTGTSFQAKLKSLIETPLSSSGSVHFTSPTKSSPGKETASAMSQNSARTPTGSKRGPKRKVFELDDSDWVNPYKRRSARNRSGRSKKEKPTIDYRLLVKKHFPPSLKQNPEPESDESFSYSHEKDSGETDKGTLEIDMSTVKSLKDSEEEDVKNLIIECFKRHGLIDIMYKFLLHLANKIHFLWTDGIADTYTEVYSRLRNHISLPSMFEGLDNLDMDVVPNHSKIVLTHCELVVDKARSYKASTTVASPTSRILDEDGKHQSSTLLGEHYSRDVEFLYLTTRCGENTDSVPRETIFRFYWMKAKQHQMVGEIFDAIDCFQIILENSKEGKAPEISIILPNMSEDKVISTETAVHELDSLHRFERLENTRKLYDQGDYAKVVDNLLTVFKKPPKTECAAQKERPCQLLLLLDSLDKLGSKEECLKWTQFAIGDCLNHYKKAANVSLKQAWAASLISSFGTLERLLDKPDLISCLEHKRLVRLAHNLVAVIEMNLEISDPLMELPIDSLLPWKILYRILKYEEEVNGDKASDTHKSEKDDNEDDEFTNSPSLQMLLDAHEYLGRYGRCTKGDGCLLLFVMSQLLAQMDTLDEDDREELVLPFEQCVLCLYNHPAKKGKSRHLCDHNAKQISLTWERSGPLFAFFSYNTMPEFDSKKTSSISSDVEHLLRRIYNLVPENLNPASRLEVVTSFIEGTSLAIPTSWPKSPQVDQYKIQKLLYYLLADFYFKNNEFKKAVKFYQLDLVINSRRMDSWAGLALAKMSQIEQELNSIDIKMDSPAPKKWGQSLRCFQRAVELESKNRKLWMEYGFLSYQQHSHASRQIKLCNTFVISDEILKDDFLKNAKKGQVPGVVEPKRAQVPTARVRCKSLLHSAGHSFNQAEICEGDGSGDNWLVYFMLGKIAEKQRNKPSVFLKHYMKAAMCLHEEKAVYPKKIVFTTTPPHLALEALEVHYRIHASVLKLLQAGALAVEDMQSVDRFLTLARKGKFANCDPKQKEQVEEDRDDIFSQGTIKSPSVKARPPAQIKVKPVYHRNPVDHEYSYFKSASDSQSSDNPDGENTISQGRSSLKQVSSSETGKSTLDIIQKIFSGNMESGSDSQKSNKSDEIIIDVENLSPQEIEMNKEAYVPNVMSELDKADKEGNEIPNNLSSSTLDARASQRISEPGNDLCQSEEIKPPAIQKHGPEVQDGSNRNIADLSVDGLMAISESKSDLTKDRHETSFESVDVKKDMTQASMDVDEDQGGSVHDTNPKIDDSVDSQSRESSQCSVFGEDVPNQTSDPPHSLSLIQSDSEKNTSVIKRLKKQESEGFTPRHLSEDVNLCAFDEMEKLDSKELDVNETEQLVLDETHFGKDELNTKTSQQSSLDKDSLTGSISDNRNEQQEDGENKQTSEANNAKETIEKSNPIATEKEKWEEEDQEKKCTENNADVDTSRQQSTLGQSSERAIDDSSIEKSENPDKKNKKEENNQQDQAEILLGSSDTVTEQVKGNSQTLDTAEGNGRSVQESPGNDQSVEVGRTSLNKENNSGSVTDNQTGSSVPTDPSGLEAEITRKCIVGLQLCASRFSSHYKSIYRLARFYQSSKKDKNLIFAHDILLGRSDWQQQSHMPAPGLFYERKLNNFFQGLWKIPNDDIDRAGSFASHLFQSVILLLQVLCELEDLEMMKLVRDQLKRNPDSTKKYLRDAERQALVEEAYKKMLDVMKKKMEDADSWPEDKRESHLASMYRLWTLGKGSKYGHEANPLLLQAFKIMMKGRTDINRLTTGQAILYCKQNISKTLMQSPTPNQGAKERFKPGQSSAPDKSKSNTTDSSSSSQKDTETSTSEMVMDKKVDNNSLAQPIKDSGSFSVTEGNASCSTTSVNLNTPKIARSQDLSSGIQGNVSCPTSVNLSLQKIVPSQDQGNVSCPTSINLDIQRISASQVVNEIEKDESVIVVSDVE